MLILGSCVVAVLGLVFGSFLNVCVTRLPQGESVVWPGSHCRSCRYVLPWYQNIPALSWLWLRGRCAYCKTRIPVRYLLLEVGTALLWVGCWLHWQSTNPAPSMGSFNNSSTQVALMLLSLLLQAMFLWLLLGLLAMDWDAMFLSDWFTIPGILFGLTWSILSIKLANADATPADTLIVGQIVTSAAFAGFLFVIRWLYSLLRKQEGLGLGDVKLAAMLGAWLSWEQSLLTLVMAVTGALIYALYLVKKQPQEESGKLALPFGSFLAGAGIVSFFVGSQLWDWYLHLWGLA